MSYYRKNPPPVPKYLLGYCYFIEQKMSGKWLTESQPYGLTIDPLKAMKFDGEDGNAKAKLYLHLNQTAGTLKDFIVTEHQFINYPKGKAFFCEKYGEHCDVQCERCRDQEIINERNKNI